MRPRTHLPRSHFPRSRTIDLTVQADVGRFGDGSDIAVRARPGRGFRPGRKSKAIFGYRAICTKYETGSGIDRFVYDLLTHGPTLGMPFRL